jgi:hypothetical protein
MVGVGESMTTSMRVGESNTASRSKVASKDVSDVAPKGQRRDSSKGNVRGWAKDDCYGIGLSS